jgi:hypothetical protein
MSLITRMLKQKAVYWGLQSSESGGVAFDSYGVPLLTSPVEINVRWEDTQEEFIDSKGTKRISSAKIFVGQDVSVGGILMLGELTDVVDETHPKENPHAGEIRSFGKVPNLRVTEYVRTVYL